MSRSRYYNRLVQVFVFGGLVIATGIGSVAGFNV